MPKVCHQPDLTPHPPAPDVQGTLSGAPPADVGPCLDAYARGRRRCGVPGASTWAAPPAGGDAFRQLAAALPRPGGLDKQLLLARALGEHGGACSACPRLDFLRDDELLELMLAPSPLHVMPLITTLCGVHDFELERGAVGRGVAYQPEPRASAVARANPELVVSPQYGSGHPGQLVEDRQVVAVHGVPGGPRLVLRDPLPINGWNAGAANWISALIERLKAAGRECFDSAVDAESFFALDHATYSRHILALCMRIRLTELSEAGETAALETWLEAEERKADELAKASLPEAHRSHVNFLIYALQELRSEFTMDVRAYRPGRLVLRGPSGDRCQDYGFEFLDTPDRLSATENTLRCYAACFQAMAGPGRLAVFGPTGSGKSETCVDFARMLGRRTLVRMGRDRDKLRLAEACASNPDVVLVLDEALSREAEVSAKELENLLAVPTGRCLMCLTGTPESSEEGELSRRAALLGFSSPPPMGTFGIVVGPKAVWTEMERPNLFTIAGLRAKADGFELTPEAWDAISRLAEALQGVDGPEHPRGLNGRLGTRTMNLYMSHMGARLREDPGLEARLVEEFCFALGTDQCMLLMRDLAEKSIPDDQPTLLNLALQLGSDSRLVELALAARRRACSVTPEGIYSVQKDSRGFQQSNRWWLHAADLMLLCRREPQLALGELVEPPEHDGVLDIPEAWQVQGLIAEALSSTHCDALLGTRALRGLVEAKLRTLWPLWLLEMLLLFCFVASYVACAYDAVPRALVVALGLYFLLVEAAQALAAREGGLLQSLRQLVRLYNLVDLLAVGMALWTSLWADAGRELVAATVFVLCMKVVMALRALEKFGFLVSMLTATVSMMGNFLVLLLIVVVSFSIMFDLLKKDSSRLGGEELLWEVWSTYRLSTMGDFDPEEFDTSALLLISFLALTFIVNIVMLNVLISIVSDGYAFAQANRPALGRRQRAAVVLDLENAYLGGWTRRERRRGEPCRLVRYPWPLAERPVELPAEGGDERDWEGIERELQQTMLQQGELTRREVQRAAVAAEQRTAALAEQLSRLEGRLAQAANR